MSDDTTNKLRAVAGGLSRLAPELHRRQTGRTADDILAQLDNLIADAKVDDWPALAVAVAARLATIASLILSSSDEVAASTRCIENDGDCLISPEQAAAIAGVTRRWICRHTRGQRFRKDLSRRQVRLQRAGFLRWLESRTARSVVSFELASRS